MRSQKSAQRNVTQKLFPCPTCKRLRSLGETKNGKPYLTCNDCFVQVFFRGKEGIRKLNVILGKQSMSGDVQGFSSLIEYLAFLKKQLNEITSNPLFKINPDIKIEEEMIEMELKRIRLLMRSESKKKKAEIRELQAAEKGGE